MSASAHEPPSEPSPKWIVGIAMTILCGLLLGGWAATAADVRDSTKKIASLEASVVANERRVTGIEDRLVRIESKLDRLIERK